MSGVVTPPVVSVVDINLATGLLQVGPGSNPPAYTPVPSMPVSGADPTKGNVARVVGYVGPVLLSPSQDTSPPITCGVFGEGNLSCPGVVGTNGPLTIADPDESGDGVFGFGSVNGVRGIGTSGTGVGGTSRSGDGVFGKTTTGIGVHGQSLGTGMAGKFEGPVEIDGDITTVNNITLQKDLKITGDITSVSTINVANDVVLTGADCAEQIDMLGAQSPEPGTIVVIDDEGKLRESQSPYDKRVAEVVSGAGDHRPAILLDRRASSEGRASVALVGKVYCKVDADPAPIAVGDLLTSSRRAGFGMKAADPAQAFGAVIGKALRPLAAGQGMIPILVALQ
jgi:hypothetical protein